jgi:uncharacterized phage protein (TIGR01671 family)
MREILFRAKAIVNQKWNDIKVGDFVYGSFINSEVDAPCIIFGQGEQIEIDRKTLCQFIGKKDENGVRIFEGDTVRSDFYYPDFWCEAVVSYCEFEARFKFNKGEGEQDAFYFGKLYVVDSEEVSNV